MFCTGGGRVAIGVACELCASGCACATGEEFAGFSLILKAFSRPRVCALSFGAGSFDAGGAAGPVTPECCNGCVDCESPVCM